MAMLAHEVDVVRFTEDNIIFKYNNKVDMIEHQDVHIMDKEWVHG
jgi:hypothetical protein